jgi:hypothetical protein
MKVNMAIISSWAPLPFWLYFIAITVAELLTVYVYPLVGVIIYSMLLIAFIIQSVFISDIKQRNLVLALCLVPIVRILSLSMPLGQLSLVFRFPIIYLPLLGATIAVMWATGLKPADVGLTFRYWPWQVPLGIISGVAMYKTAGGFAVAMEIILLTDARPRGAGLLAPGAFAQRTAALVEQT